MGNCHQDVRSFREDEIKAERPPEFLMENEKSAQKDHEYRDTGSYIQSIVLDTYYPLIQAPDTESHNKEVVKNTKIDGFENQYIFEYVDGSRYIGDVGKTVLQPHGNGVFTHSNGDVYDGRFYQGLAHGKGSYTYRSGITYSGSMSNDLKNGFGEENYGNSEIYRGYFLDGMRNGRGRYEWSDGSIYDGEIVNNKKQGYGILSHPNGQSSTGYWFENKRHGMGKIKYPNGDVYEGPFSKNVKEGKGILHTAEYVYEGWFSNDLLHGQILETDRRSNAVSSVNYLSGVKSQQFF